MSILDAETPRSRWSRSQRFQLSATGTEAGASYRNAIVAARAEGGRRSFDDARSAWAQRLALEPSDGLYLGELRDGPRTIAELATGLEGCGPQRSEVRAVVERLIRLTMLELVIPPPPALPPPRRW